MSFRFSTALRTTLKQMRRLLSRKLEMPLTTGLMRKGPFERSNSLLIWIMKMSVLFNPLSGCISCACSIAKFIENHHYYHHWILFLLFFFFLDWFCEFYFSTQLSLVAAGYQDQGYHTTTTKGKLQWRLYCFWANGHWSASNNTL